MSEQGSDSLDAEIRAIQLGCRVSAHIVAEFGRDLVGEDAV